VRALRRRRNLWQEKRRNIERVIGQFHNTDFSLKIDACDSEVSSTDLVLKFRIEPVITEELFDNFLAVVSSMGMRARRNLYPLVFSNKGAGQFADKKCLCTWGCFFVLRVSDSQHIACILYQSMLKTSSGSNEGYSHLTSEANTPERTVHAFIRAAGRAP
jgi:hypothetical protein